MTWSDDLNQCLHANDVLQVFLLVASCVGLALADFVGLDPEQLARVGRQEDDGAVQVNINYRLIFSSRLQLYLLLDWSAKLKGLIC